MSESSATQLRALAELLGGIVRALALLPGEERVTLLGSLQELQRRCGLQVGEDHLMVSEAVGLIDRLAGRTLMAFRHYPTGQPELDGIRTELEGCRADFRASVGPGAAARATGERGK